MFQISEVQESPAFNGRRSFLTLRDSKRHPLNSADGSAVRNTKRYTLTHRVATATTLITIRGILRHGKFEKQRFSAAGKVRADAEVQTRAGFE